MKAVKRILALTLSLVMAFAVLPAGIFRVHAETVTLEKLTEAPKNGDKVVIYHPSSNNAMGSAPSGKKIAAVSAALDAEGKLSLGEDMAYLTVTVTDGVYSFALGDGTYLTSGQTGNSLSFASELSDLGLWTLKAQEDGTWVLMNKGANYKGNYNQALEYYSGFTTYGVKANDAAYKFDFYAAPATPDEPDPVDPEPSETVLLAKLEEAPKDGDKVVIYHPASGNAMGTTPNGNKLSPVASALEDEKLSLTEDMAYLTVGVTEGEYSFKLEDGTYLATGATGGNLSFVSELTDLALWIMDTKADGTYTLTNKGAAYSGNHNQALEFFRGAFTTYGLKDSTDYGFHFYAEEKEPEPEHLVPDGDYIIYNPAHKVAVSGEYNGYYNMAEEITVDDVTKEQEVDAALIWHVTNNDDDGTITISHDGKNWGMAASYSSITLEGENKTWVLEETETEGLYLIKNAGRGLYVEYYAKNNNFSGYGNLSQIDLFQFNFVPAKVKADEPDTPEVVILDRLTEAPKDGDLVAIYHPASSNALGIEASGKKLAGVEAELDADGRLPLDAAMAYLTVGESNGVYTFALDDGTYLTSGAAGNSLSFSAELTDLGRWTLEAQEDGTWVIMNKGANYKGNYNQALEYYSGFTTYGVKANDAAYKFDFYGIVEQDDHLVPDGDYIIYNPAHTVAVSGEYSGYYNKAESITIDDVTKEQEVDAALIWHVTNNDDGTITISHDGKNWGMAASYSSITLEGENNTWVLEETETDGLYLIKNAGRGLYVEYYAKNNNFSGYGNLSQIDLFQFNFVPAKVKEDYDSVLKDGDQVVIYHPHDGASLAMPNDLGTALGQAPTTIDGDMAVPGNGARVFTVGVVGDNKYTFKSGSAGYLATNKGETLFFSPELADDNETACTYWTLTPNGDSYIIYSSTAKYNTSYVCIEAFGGNFSGWTYKSSDKDLFLFNFYPVTEDTLVVDGIVDKPIVTFDEKDAYAGTEYELKVNITSLFEFDYQDLTVTVNGTTVDIDRMVTTTGLVYMVYVTVPAEMVTGDSLEVKISGADKHGAPIEGSISIPIIDEPFIKDMTPGRNEETGENKAPLIGAVITNFGENPSIVMKVNGEEVEVEFDALTGKLTYAPKEDLQDGKVTVEIIVTRADGAVGREQWSFWIGEATFSLYFGQLHSHTQYSDGAGTLETALNYISNIPESANVQFVAFTDHSNYFDTTSAANPEGALYDASKMTAESAEKWNTYNRLATEFNETHSNILALSGFEMTWSGGPGHINTFKTPGIVSRNNTTLNSKTNDAGLKAYYSLLCESALSDSISQFNHPGSTFGTFVDFAYYDPVIDTRMYLVEVGNGEGQIGAGGYYPSYEYYTMALDKGWHVAPTNNQDNHKGSWGNANNARDVILTDDFSVDGLYKAIRDYRVYATEDKNLEILYTVNDEPLGSMFFDVPEELNINVSVYDPDNNDSISKVEVIVNSGKTAYTWDDPAQLADGELSVTLSPEYTYYYIRVTEGDGDLAVTAPVWVGDNLLLGISSFESGTAVPVTGEEITLTTTLFNGESTDATVKSLTYTMDGSEVIGTDTQSKTIAAGGTLAVDFGYTADKAKITKITVTAVIEQDGKEYVFTKDIELDISDADSLVYLGIDASHYNEYVSGNYKDSMGNFSLLASEYGVRTVILDTSDDLIAACENEKYVGLIFTAPSRRLAAAQEELRAYSDDELAAIKAFNDRGGLVVVAGWSDYYENYPAVKDMDPSLHMAAVQNSILEALGTELRINDDATYDDELNGGQPQRLYFNTYNMDNFLMEGVEVDPDHPNDRLYTEVYSHYGGASIYTESGKLEGTVSPAVFGHASTYSKDADEDGIGGESAKKYPVTGTASSGTHAIRPMADPDERLLITATDEQEGKGKIVVSGAAFMSNFEVQATIEDSGSEKNYSNYKICENLLKQLNENEVTTIEGVRNVTEEGYKFTIEGIVTSNASGYDKDTAFFDCIYVQDETAGICCFPVAGDYKIGDKVRITGSTDFYQGEPELQVISITKIGEEECPAPEEITAAQENDRSEEGKLVKVSGTITKVEVVDGQLQTIIYKDDSGEEGRIFIDGYITTVSAGYEDVANAEVGNKVTAIGLASYDDTFNAPEGPFPRIRIRDRADVVCEVVEPQEPDDPEKPDEPVTPGDRPVTGDMNSAFGWITVFTLAAAALALLIFTKSENKGKHYRK